MYYTYVIKSKKDGKLYTGLTNSIRKRLWERNNGKSSYTNGRGPFTLIYCEMCSDSLDARARELYLKSGKGKIYIKNRLKRFLFRTG